MNIEIIKAKLVDSEFAYQLKKAGLQSYLAAFGGWDENEQRKSHQRRFAQYPFFIIHCNGAKAGVISYKLDDETLHLFQMFIAEKYRSQGMGKYCIEYLKTKHKRQISLQVLNNNTKAQAFYERLGFEAVGETETHIKYQDCYV